MKTKEKTVRKFSGKDEIGYVFGDMAGSFVNLFVDAYFLTFCTYALGIEAGWMATLFLVARLFGTYHSCTAWTDGIYYVDLGDGV